ncbi:family 20 glycosylhydrolase [Pinibacter aurantiacus]|uniref:Family 20 glycosylhydrolase n=1 Tax=Pinibacter aurantiacus TaxID=2851599 RepID=A0A9E2W4H7_9BACT|nr:family 20 glycosylhydrolase [Pinibacter aurantiacus]MBV4357498.1 family 20 glycosylhydrolase [Pinibacter aurantiacus]
MKEFLLLVALLTGCFVYTNNVNAQNEAEVNASPFVIPALREWKGGVSYLEWPNNVKLVVDPAYRKALLPVAKLFAEDLHLLSSDMHPKVITGQASPGNVYFTLRPNDSSLPAEGYVLDISNSIRIDAKDSIGAIWATRSLLQILEREHLHHRIPKGVARDYPKYAVRGFVLDVARKFFTIEFLRDYVKFMSYYKMNDFQIHLSDNGFKDFFGGNWDSTYAAFRLENTTYPNLTAKDGSYSKAEFVALQQMAQRYGVNIIPEIDVPAHSLAFSKAVPGIGSKLYGQDHLDLDNPLTYTVVDNVFKEYLQGPNPVFIGNEVHIGTDEYAKKEAEKFRAFTDHYIRFVEGYGKKVRMWGSLTHAEGSTPVKVENVTMNLWYNGYADPKTMFDLGYKGISTPDGWLYIVPAAGYYYDYLNTKKLYDEWTPNRIGKETFDENYPLLRGGSFAVWNDHVGNGITEKDVHHRVFPAMQVLSQKMWGGSVKPMGYDDFAAKSKQIGEGPGLNMLGRLAGKDSLVFSLDTKENVTKIHNAHFDKTKEELDLKGDDSYLKTNITGIGYDYTVSFCIKPSKDNLPDAVLFSSKDAVVVLNMQGSGKLGFSREGYSYSFNYAPPAGAWTHITIKGNNKGTSLYVNGVLAEKLEGAKRTFANGKQTAKVQTLFFPLQYIGSNSNACKAQISDLKVFNRELDEAVIKGIAEEVKSQK